MMPMFPVQLIQKCARSEYMAKFKKMGIEAEIDDVITSAVGAAR